jgi:hypothetical protein
MKRRYSNELIGRCKKLIEKKSGKDITDDEAEIYLDKFADLMKTTVKIVDQEKAKKK